MLYGFAMNVGVLLGWVALLAIVGLIAAVVWFALLPRINRERARFREYRRRQLREAREELASFDEDHRQDLAEYDALLDARTKRQLRKGPHV